MDSIVKIAVVTGASKGIGLGVAKALLDRGYRVWGVSRSEPDEDLGDNFHFVEFDLSNADEISKLAEKLPSGVDLLVNNAGTWEVLPLSKVTSEYFDQIMTVNFRSPVFLTVSLLPRFRQGGAVINISSEMGRITDLGYGIYSSSKAALDRFTTTLAKEQRDKLTVIGILPSSVDTPGARAKFHYTVDPNRLTVEEVTGVVMKAVDHKLETGSLVLVYNNECLPYWEARDRYTLVNVDVPGLTK